MFASLWPFVWTSLAVARPVAPPPTVPDRVLLDAGPTASVRMEGWHALTPHHSQDPRVSWHRRPSAAAQTGTPDPLRADHITGGVLQLDLPPGAWHVAAVFGSVTEDLATHLAAPQLLRHDSGAPQPLLPTRAPTTWQTFAQGEQTLAAPRPAFVPGTTAWDRQILPDAPWHHATVQVGTAGLKVEASGQPLQALVAWRDGTEDPRQTLADPASRAWFDRHAHPDVPAPLALPGPLGADLHLLDAPAFRADTAHDHALLVPAGGRDVRALTLSGGDAPGTWTVEGRDRVPGLTVRLWEATWRDASPHPSLPVRPRPTELRDTTRHAPLGGWVGSQWTPPTGLLEVQAAADTPPGTYTFAVLLQRDGEQARVPFLVEVPKTSHSLQTFPAGVFWQASQPAMSLDGVDSATAVASVEHELDLFSDLGFTALSARYTLWPDRWPSRRAEAPGTPAPTATFDHIAAAWAARGGTDLVWSDPKVPLRANAYGRTTGPTLTAQHAPGLRKLMAAAEAAPLPVWLHLWEEEAGTKHLHAVSRGPEFFAAVRKLAPDRKPPRLLATVPTPADRTIAPVADRVLMAWPWLDPGAVHEAQQQGAEVWTYNGPAGGTAVLAAWALGATGHLQWHADPILADSGDLLNRRTRWRQTVRHGALDVRPTWWLFDSSLALTDVRLLATLAAHSPDHPLLAQARALYQPVARPGHGAAPPAVTHAARAALRHAVADALQRLK